MVGNHSRAEKMKTLRSSPHPPPHSGMEETVRLAENPNKADDSDENRPKMARNPSRADQTEDFTLFFTFAAYLHFGPDAGENMKTQRLRRVTVFGQFAIST